jgi:tetratricopeptide (TPR) repeat protein
MKRIFIAMFVFAYAAALFAFRGDYGTESVFSLGAGVRSVSMGSAYTSLSDDNGGIAFNPAGLAWLPRQQASLLYYPLYENTLMNSITYGMPILDFGTAAAAFYRVSTDGIKGYDALDTALSDFSYGEYKVSIVYAKPVSESLSIGMRVNAYGVNVLKVNSAGFGADAGLIYRPMEWLSMGIMLENIVKPYIALMGASEDLPQRYVMGASGSFSASGFKAVISADFLAGEREKFKYRAGAEIGYNSMIFLRAGYDDGQMCFGGGLELFNASVDYAYVAGQYMGGLSVMGVSYNFGMSIDEQKRERAKEIREQVKKLVDEKISGDMNARADIIYEKAWAFWYNAKYEEALDELQKALEWAPTHRKSNNLKSWINLRLKELYYDSAVAFYNSGDYIRSIENFKTLQKYDDNFRDAASYPPMITKKLGLSGADEGYFLRGVDYYVKKHYNEAVKEWNKIQGTGQGNKAVKECIIRAQETADASAQIHKKEASADDKARSERAYYSAVDAYTSGDTAKAISLWEEAIKMNPDNIGAQRDLEKAKYEMDELRRRGIN